MNNPTITTQSPGRINIIGEHTDYNEGFVLPAAIDKKATFQLKKNGTTNTVNITATNLEEHYSFELANFKPLKEGWQNYVMGVVKELQNIGANFSGFDAEFSGDVPIGSGMSSSAALECSMAYGLNKLFDLGFDKWQLIKAAQMAEHNFVGTKCGIMDQFASMMGQKNQVMLLDCRSLDFKYFPFDLGNYQLLLLNTNVSHSLSSTEYNTRRAECLEGVATIKKRYPEKEINSLRDISFDMLIQATKELSPTIFNRCKHIILENNRVLQATEALVSKDFNQLGKLVYKSHFSLQNDYEVSCKELDFLVQQTLDKDYILGSRMMGGGFGGCTITIIEKKWVDAFTELVTKNYKTHTGIDLTPYTVSIENGTELI